MRRTTPLYEFMPYGAPELMEAGRPQMSRALLLSSATALVVYALSSQLAPLLERKIEPPNSTVVDITAVWPPPPPLVNVAPPPAAPAPPIVRQTPSLGVPVPVPEAAAVPAVAPSVGPSDAHETGAPSALVPSNATAVAPATEALPPFGTWVYVEQLPQAIKEVKPIYPALAIEAGIEGLVTVHVLVGTDGRVRDVRLDAKQHVPILDPAALEAARQWVFMPGMANQRPVACWEAIPFRFRLH
jgi:protein TonB